MILEMRTSSERSSHGRKVEVENLQFLVHTEIVSMLGPTSEVTLLTVIGIYHYKNGYIAIYVVQSFWPVKCPRPDEAQLCTHNL